MSTMLEILGKPARVEAHVRRRPSDRVDAGRMHWDGLSCSLHFREMPPRLARLLPYGYLYATGAEWVSFVREALVVGWFKKETA